MLGEQMRRHEVKCWLVNTGWVGGAFGIGERMNLKYTRAMVNAAIAGELDDVPVEPHPVFRVLVPRSVPGVPSELLDARGQWKDKAAYDRAAEDLSARFSKNFESSASQRRDHGSGAGLELRSRAVPHMKDLDEVGIFVDTIKNNKRRELAQGVLRRVGNGSRESIDHLPKIG